MATVIFIKESRQNPSAMRAVINYCQQEYKAYDSKSKRKLERSKYFYFDSFKMNIISTDTEAQSKNFNGVYHS